MCSLQRGVLAPGLLWLETANALLTGISRDHSRAFELARRYDNGPVYDMVYVAERASTEFVTADQSSRLVSRISAGCSRPARDTERDRPACR